MTICLGDDGKGKRQSVTASAFEMLSVPNGHAQADLVAYGCDEADAKSNLRCAISALRGWLAEIEREVNA